MNHQPPMRIASASQLESVTEENKLRGLPRRPSKAEAKVHAHDVTCQLALALLEGRVSVVPRGSPPVGPKFSVAEVARVLRCSHTTAQAWIGRADWHQKWAAPADENRREMAG